MNRILASIGTDFYKYCNIAKTEVGDESKDVTFSPQNIFFLQN